MKDLLITIHNGGDEAVSAVQRMGEDWRAMLEQAASEIERRWIPVTERLPDRQWDGFSDIVVVAAGNAYFLGRYYRCDIGDECHECDSDIGERWYIETTAKPTHWMPLPTPPTDAK